MQAAAAAAAAALTVLSVFCSLDGLSAQRPEPNQTDSHAGNEEAGPKKKNQPHILFILTDDQVCVCVCYLWNTWRVFKTQFIMNNLIILF